ncbi:pickpocket protein 28 [Anastrepha obliqua]|uniref:pickpocket protein 28 n=1 Tax=Anastrepha obliqua TaxID=95512 RepID=UPI002408FC0C|nr:pickpocket protein 28 [Anastrepha obliqua]
MNNMNLSCNKMDSDFKGKRNNLIRNTPQRKTLVKGIKEMFFEYCSNTSIHGIQYFGQHRPWMENIFWLCVFLASIYCCSNLILSVYIKWNETPVIVSFSEKSTPVWSIPFPAITICSETKRVLKTEGVTYAQFTKDLQNHIKMRRRFEPKNISDIELEEFRTLLHICNTQLIERGTRILSTDLIDYFSVLNKMTPEFSRYFFYCKWFSHFGECDELFTRTYTEEGICYTFNGLNATDIYRENTVQYQRMGFQNFSKHNIILKRPLKWSLQDGYTPDSGIKSYPARVLGAGARAGLFIALQSFRQEVDYVCRGPIQGFKVSLHSPDDVPLVSNQFVRIPMSKEVLIAVKPNMITTSSGIADYPPQRRQCFLKNERTLKFFKVYTQNNCALECLTNLTLAKCGCVKFSMPRTLDMPVCGENKIFCYDKAEDILLLREFRQGLKESRLEYLGTTECNCLPACTSLIYNTEISQGNFDLDEMLKAANDTSFYEEFPGSQMSRLSIYFKERQFITSKRSELYGRTDFLANCGGIFGLFMGFSMLSLVELFYHISLRLWNNLHRLAGPQTPIL